MADQNVSKPEAEMKDAPVVAPVSAVKEVPKPAEWVVLPVDGGTSEVLKQALETFKKAKAQYNKACVENDAKEKEIQEKKEDKPGEALDTWLVAEPTYKWVDPKKETKSPKATEEKKTQPEIELDKKREKEKKEVLDVLTKIHEKQTDEILRWFDFNTLNDDTKKVIHADALADWVDITKVEENAKKEALIWFISFDDKPIDYKNLTPEQVEIVQQHTAKKYLDSLKGVAEEIKNDPEKFKNQLLELEKTQPGITAFVSKQKVELINEENFFKAAKENPVMLEKTIESIKKDGFVLSGIDPESELWKSLTKVIEENVDEYLKIAPPKADTIDLENFKGLRDIVRGGYKDLIYADKNFLLWEDHPLKQARDTAMKNFAEAASKRDESSPTYQSEVAQDFTNATWLDGRQELQNLTRGASRFNLSPMCRFLADLFAPFWALFPPPAGDFWRSYLNDSSWWQSLLARNAQIDSRRAGGGWPIDGKPITGQLAWMKDIANTETNRHIWSVEGASNAINSNRARYERVAQATWVPWELIGAIHYREADLDFNTYLHQWDPLGKPAVNEPNDIPIFYNWEEAAIHAIKQKWSLWFTSIDGSDEQLRKVADFAERYNGLGYRNKWKISPYVWSWTSLYTGGRYVADHVYNANSYDTRPGVMPIINSLLKKNGIQAPKSTDSNEQQTSQGIFVGDSITTAMRGGEDDGVATKTPGYGEYYQIGASSSTILGYVDNAIEANPPSISILAGTNDITSGWNPLWNIQAMVQKCRAANIPVYLGTLPPIRGKESTVDEVNTWIRALAGEGVQIIDYASLFKKEWINTTDGVHPNSNWYKEMRNLASSQIQNSSSNRPWTMVA